MRINLGSGDRYLKDHVNVDLYAERADIREDIRTVEIPAGTCDVVQMIHVIEHVNRREGLELLRRIHGWLKPSGKLIIETPDRCKCLHLIRAEEYHTDKRGIKRLIGAVGICGGRPAEVDQQRYHDWLRINRVWIVAETEEKGYFPPVLIPDEFVSPGANHEYVWEESELTRELMALGYHVRSERPKTHGNRDWRDMRLVCGRANEDQ